MPKKKISIPHYDKLIASVTSIIAKGLLAAQKALEYQRVKTYWQVGKMVRSIAGRSKGELVLGEKLYKRISDDLRKNLVIDVSADTVGRMVQFNKNYPQFPKKTPLTFTHYIALQRIKDPAKRARLEARVIKEGLDVLQTKGLLIQMASQGGPAAAKSLRTLNVVRGEPYVYATMVNTDIKGKRTVCVDCGFKINVDIPKDNLYRPKQSRIVRSVKKAGGYRIIESKNRDVARYTYGARVTRVVDADTIDARIDVGFGIHINERLRLKGINAPEMNLEAGKIARDFLKKKLAKSPTIIIRSEKDEMYGRWIADIFVLPKCDDLFKIAAEGEYLNQTLLDEGLADLYRG